MYGGAIDVRANFCGEVETSWAARLSKPIRTTTARNQQEFDHVPGNVRNDNVHSEHTFGRGSTLTFIYAI